MADNNPHLCLLPQIPLHHHFSCMPPTNSASLPFFPQSDGAVFTPTPQGFVPPPWYQYASFHHTPTTPYLNTNTPNSAGPYGFTQSGYRPYGYPYLALTPPPSRVNVGFLEPSTKELQQQQSHVLPYQPSIFGPVRRGTGVFHPPLINHAPQNIAHRNTRPQKKRGRRNNNNNNQVNPRGSKNSSKREGLSKQEGCPQPQEIALPNEWTY